MATEDPTATEDFGIRSNWKHCHDHPGPALRSTDLGRLRSPHLRRGPPVVLWHSLFVDSRSWDPLIENLGRQRTVYAIDGPSHGRSEAVRRDFTFAECVAVASGLWTGWG